MLFGPGLTVPLIPSLVQIFFVQIMVKSGMHSEVDQLHLHVED